MKHNLIAQITISAYTEVEAENAEEALKIANKRGVCFIHVSQTDTAEDCWMVDSIDGEPEKIEIAE